jgi:membrane fusion protein (multidrug efflux system)
MIAATLVMLTLLTGCGKSTKWDANLPNSGALRNATEVGIITLTAREVTLTQELPARVFAFREAEVRARVDGIVQKRSFEEGAFVNEGEILYQIDPATYQTALNSAQASLAKARSNSESTRLKVQRYQTLLESHATSRQEYEDALAALQAYEADVLSAEAQVEAAQIDLGYTRVIAPVSGRIGKSEITEGAYVRRNDATLMATVRQFDKVYVDMTQSSADQLRLKQSYSRNEIQQAGETDSARVSLTLEDGSTYALEGTLKFADIAASAGTSSVTVRALFPNPDGYLLPGMFVRARIVEGKKPNAVLAPQAAVMRNQKGEPYAYIAREDGVAEQRALAVSRSVGNEWLVESGLSAGEHLIVDNLQCIADGVRIAAVSVEKNKTSPWSAVAKQSEDTALSDSQISIASHTSPPSENDVAIVASR